MSAITVPAIAALRLRHSRRAFVDAFQAMPIEKQNWKPTLDSGHGRSARELVEECVLTNTTFSFMLMSGTEADIDWPDKLAKLADRKSDSLVAEFCAGNEALETVIKSMSDDYLSETFMWSWAERNISYAEFAFIPAWHLDYHAGQINYIQTLYGDGDDHSAPA